MKRGMSISEEEIKIIYYNMNRKYLTNECKYENLGKIIIDITKIKLRKKNSKLIHLETEFLHFTGFCCEDSLSSNELKTRHIYTFQDENNKITVYNC